MTAIFMLAISIGTVVPLLLIFILYKGIERAPFDAFEKATWYSRSIIFTTVWTALVWALSIAGTFDYHQGDTLPKFVIPLMVPVFIGLVFLRSENFRIMLDIMPLSLMVGVQTFRLMGVLFILVVNAGLAPHDFANGGYGDLLTGSLALIAALMLNSNTPGAKMVTWLFMGVGIADLLNVAFLLLFYYPIWNSSTPSSAGATEFPLILVLGLAAPFALTFHLYTLRRLVLAGQLQSRKI